MSKRYLERGVSSQKEDDHKAIKNQDKGLFENTFCKIVPDILSNDPQYCNIMHADGAGTKSALAYLYWKETGDLDVLSAIDQKLLALGYELEGIIISDDFSIQNVALYMKLEVISCSGNKIKELRIWQYKCSACNKISKKKKETCEVCGSEDIFRIKAK